MHQNRNDMLGTIFCAQLSPIKRKLHLHYMYIYVYFNDSILIILISRSFPCLQTPDSAMWVMR